MGTKIAAAVGRGVSVQNAFATYMAHVAEVEVAKDGTVRVRRVVCAVDCGIVVNPDTVRAQIQSAVMFGITAALYGEITVKTAASSRPTSTATRCCGSTRRQRSRSISCRVRTAGRNGQAGTSAIVPAVANAIFAATGKRLRKMPVDPAALKQPS